jgi:hypothetical protein
LREFLGNVKLGALALSGEQHLTGWDAHTHLP